MPPSPEYFINTFITATNKPGLQQWCGNPSSAQRKKFHHKSRSGCLTCRQRRVKCDENIPSCHRCLKRGDICCPRPARQQQQEEQSSKNDERWRQGETNPPSCPFPSPISTHTSSGDRSLNMEQLRLFHHFQTSTHRTLPVIAQIWESVLPKAFEYEYLMHAALCLAARHLEYLRREKDKTAETTLSRKHLAHTLRLFREALSCDITDANRDAVLCTSFMLYFEAWSDTAFLPPERDWGASQSTSAYSASEDQLFTLSKCMRDVCMYTMSNSVRHGPSILKKVLLHRPILHIKKSLLSVGRDFDGYCLFFEQLWHEQGEQAISQRFCDVPQPQHARYKDTLQDPQVLGLTEYQSAASYEAFMHVVQRLSALLSLLPINSQDTTEPSVLESHPDLLLDVSRVVYTFPILLHPDFMDMLFEGDTRILVILYHFFRMVNQLLPKEECWWVAERAESFEFFLRQKLWG